MEIVLDPISQVEGHMRILLNVEKCIVKEARCSSTLFRGFERVLVNQEPRRAACFTTRICGACPTAHAMAGAKALDQIYGVEGSIPEDAILARNMLHGFDFISNHLTHIYFLWLPDLVNPAYRETLSAPSDFEKLWEEFIARFTPLYSGTRHPIRYKKLWGEFIARFAPPVCRIDNTHIPTGRSYLRALQTRKLLHTAIRRFAGGEVLPFAGGLEIKPAQEIVHVLEKGHSDVMSCLSTMLGVAWKEWIENTYLASPEGAAKYFVDLGEKNLSKKNFSAMGDFELFAAIGADITGYESLMLDKFGCHDNGFLSFGAFQEDGRMKFRQGFMSPELEYSAIDINKITEDCTASFYSGDEHHPFDGKTEPLPPEEIIYGSKYTWVKAPRYNGMPCEVGSLARLLIAGEPLITGLADMFRKKKFPAANIYMRIIARIQEMLVAGYLVEGWIKELNPAGIYKMQAEKPVSSRGIGLWEAPRGALGHWVSIKKGLISSYQIITPTTWNASPGGVIEKSLTGCPVRAMGSRYGVDCSNLITALHIVKSFDPCNQCAVHVMDGSRIYKIKA